jgi:hypothetical protein
VEVKSNRAIERTTVVGSGRRVNSDELPARVWCAASSRGYRRWCQLQSSKNNKAKRPGVLFGSNAKPCMRAGTLPTNHERTMTPTVCTISEMAGNSVSFLTVGYLKQRENDCVGLHSVWTGTL